MRGFIITVLLVLAMGVTSAQISIQPIPQYPVINGSVTVSVTGITDKLEHFSWYKGPSRNPQYQILFYIPGIDPTLVNGPLYNDRISAFNNGSLHIKDLRVTDGGNYAALIQTTTPAYDVAVTLTVYDGPDNAQIDATDGAAYVTPGSSITLTCSADSVPPPEYQWKHNVSVLAEKTSKYTISDAAPENEGQYTCTVKNPVTLRTGTASVYVNVTAEYTEPHNTSTGLILGLTIGTILGVVLVIIISVFSYRKILTKKRNGSSENRQDHGNVYENVMAVQLKEESSYMDLKFKTEDTYAELKT